MPTLVLIRETVISDLEAGTRDLVRPIVRVLAIVPFCISFTIGDMDTATGTLVSSMMPVHSTDKR